MNYTLVDDPSDAPDIKAVRFEPDRIILDLTDGRVVGSPLSRWPSLWLATDAERLNYEIRHYAVHWPLLDCDLSSECLLRGAKEDRFFAENAWKRFLQREYSIPPSLTPV